MRPELKTLTVLLSELDEDWAKMAYFVCNTTGATLGDVNRMDVMEFFSLYRVAASHTGK